MSTSHSKKKCFSRILSRKEITAKYIAILSEVGSSEHMASGGNSREHVLGFCLFVFFFTKTS